MRISPATIASVVVAMMFSIAAAVGPTASSAPDEGGSAVATVEALHQALLASMRQGDALDFAGRRQLLAPVVDRSFDFATISATVLGVSQWRKLTDEQRSKMEETFRELTLATYTDRFDGYSGEKFRTISQRPLRQGRALVRSELRIPDENPVRLDYVLHRVGDDWRIVNILADGVSDLSVKRAEYGSILRSDGFDELIARLEEQLEELSID